MALRMRCNKLSQTQTITLGLRNNPRLAGSDELAEHGYLPLHHFSTRSADRLPPLHTSFKIEHLVHIGRKVVVKTLKILQSQLVQLAFAGFRKCYCPPRDVMRLAEWNLM